MAKNDDLPTIEQRWSIASVALEKHGFDTSKIAGLRKAQILGQLEADEVIGADENIWEDWVSEMLDEHPEWAKPGALRRKHAEELLDSWDEREDESDDLDTLAASKYAVVSWYDKRTAVYSAGDTIESVLDEIYALHYQALEPEWVEAYYDLHTGQRYEVIGGAGQLKVTVTLSLGNVRRTFHS